MRTGEMNVRLKQPTANYNTGDVLEVCIWAMRLSKGKYQVFLQDFRATTPPLFMSGTEEALSEKIEVLEDEQEY